MPSHAVVINARSGSLLGQDRAEESLAAQLAAAGLDAHVIDTAGQPDLGDRIEAAIASGAGVVVVAGGDGTIAAAAQRLVGTGIALGILPLGTMNMLAKDLGIPAEPEAAIAALAAGVPRQIDVAEVNGHVFLCKSVLGLPTALGRHRERHRGGAGLRRLLRLALAAIRTFWRYRPLRLELAFDDEPPRILRSRAVAVANNAYADGFGAVFTRERIDRGELVLYLAHRFGAWWAIRMLLAMALGGWRDRPEIDERAAGAITIGSRRASLRVMNDGEVLLLAPPLRYVIRPGALTVIVPA